MAASDRGELPVLEGLDSDGNPVDAGGRPGLCGYRRDVLGIRLERHLRARRNGEASPEAVEQMPELRLRCQRGRSAAQVERVEVRSRRLRTDELHLAIERVPVG